MKQYLKVAAIAVIVVNTVIKRVPVVGPMVGKIVGGL